MVVGGAVGLDSLRSTEAVVRSEEANGLLVDFPCEAAGHFFSASLDRLTQWGKAFSLFPLSNRHREGETKGPG